MAIKITPPKTEAGIEFDHLHLRSAVNTATENDDSPFSMQARFRLYKKNGDNKLFAPTDKIGFIEVNVPDVEAFAMGLAQQGRLEEAQLIGQAIVAYEKALALFISEKHPELTVEVV